MIRILRDLAILFVAFTLGACAPTLAPRGLENDRPLIEQDDFLTRDGLKLPLRHWDADHPRAIIVALHGMSDYANAFDMPARWWRSQGITTYAYDQRGFGSSPHQGLWAGGDALRGDIADFVAAAHEKHPGLPVYVLGESMGGAVALSAAASEEPPAAQGIILVAPAVWSRADMPALYRVGLWTAAHTVPWLKLSGRGLHLWPSDNLDMLRKLARDPLFQHETRADAVYGLVDLMDEARHAPAELRQPPPILLVYGEKDQIIPRPPTEAVAVALGSRAEVRHYPYGYHMLLRDLSGPTVWQDIAGWVGRRGAGGARQAAE